MTMTAVAAMTMTTTTTTKKCGLYRQVVSICRFESLYVDFISELAT